MRKSVRLELGLGYFIYTVEDGAENADTGSNDGPREVESARFGG